jgi:hypothetical protein
MNWKVFSNQVGEGNYWMKIANTLFLFSTKRVANRYIHNQGRIAKPNARCF